MHITEKKLNQKNALPMFVHFGTFLLLVCSVRVRRSEKQLIYFANLNYFIEFQSFTLKGSDLIKDSHGCFAHYEIAVSKLLREQLPGCQCGRLTA
jgi:hypothetical protein